MEANQSKLGQLQMAQKGDSPHARCSFGVGLSRESLEEEVAVSELEPKTESGSGILHMLGHFGCWMHQPLSQLVGDRTEEELCHENALFKSR